MEKIVVRLNAMAKLTAAFLSLSLLFIFCHAVKDKYDWKCTDQICQDVLCPLLPKECMDSERALLVPSIDRCNCCDHCIIYLNETEDCLLSNQDLQLPTVMCGPNLVCNSNGKCEKMTEGEDPDFFPNYECKDRSCQCAVINEKGNVIPIFGKFRESEIQKNEKQCACSVAAYKAMTQEFRVLPFEGIYQPSARCLPNGQFDPLQCIYDRCGCVDRDTGIPDEHGLTYTLQALERNHPICFDPKRHKKGDYYTPCEKRRNKLMEEINEKYWIDLNFIHSNKINCYPDGTPVI